MAYGRPDWAGQYQQPMYSQSPATTGGAPPGMVAHTVPRPPAVRPPVDTSFGGMHTDYAQGGHPLSTVYSFVPIPGAQQHKRPRRRYEEIERMYKCGWNGCEKAYGTLNHLNAHVTMQGHGQKRTPEGKKSSNLGFTTVKLDYKLEWRFCGTFLKRETDSPVAKFARALSPGLIHACYLASLKLPNPPDSTLHTHKYAKTFMSIR